METFKTFSEFELCVQNLCLKEDYINNRPRLKELRIDSYETFLSLLRNAGKIEYSIKAADEISKMSMNTSLTEVEILDLTKRFRLIIGLIDK